MKSFYSILKLMPNVATQDSVALGLILFDGQKFHHYLSEKKIKIAKKLVNTNSIDFEFLFNQIINNLEEDNIVDKNKKLFKQFDNFSNSHYFEYLNRYSNGLVQFSKPKPLFNPIDEFEFDNLVNLLFGETFLKESNETKNDSKRLKNLVNKNLIKKVENNVHVNYKFSPKLFPSIYFNFEIDCIGINGSLIGAKTLTFDRSLQSIDNNVSHYFTLISNLSNTYNKSLKENKFYLISEEPKEIDSKAHNLWETLSKNELISVKHPEESDEIAQFILDKKATKFLDTVR